MAMERKQKAATESLVLLVVLALICVAVNALGAFGMYVRKDLTKVERYTLSQGSGRLLKSMKQNMTVEAKAADRAAAEAQFAELEKSGQRVKPEFGSVFYHLQGPDEARGRGHMTVAVPGATMASLGLPETGRGGGVWIMNAGTTTAHLMIPGE